ncbi:hypothetical protein [Candidatus Protochlamydia amoebophila]|uniref:Uncharacterized protein n=1 Tax=Candidatus Protochlamydia amoebophila TaxID=362787 RepID=A0A0C1H1Y4_9BACT|nr:hypothetical protein [Candidatus Protochlamydia amoebophila]KIC71704.1 hypothetical protein DB44_DE00300 [Candidatus Protochlamydia amoebophila]
MSIVEFIGFAISFFSLIFLFFRNQAYFFQGKDEEREGRKWGNEPLQVFLKKKEKEKKKEVAPSLKPSISSLNFNREKKNFEKQKDVLKKPEKLMISSDQLKDSLKQKFIINDVADLRVELLDKQPLVKIMIGDLKDLKDIIIYREILDKPKSLRSWD